VHDPAGGCDRAGVYDRFSVRLRSDPRPGSALAKRELPTRPGTRSPSDLLDLPAGERRHVSAAPRRAVVACPSWSTILTGAPGDYHPRHDIPPNHSLWELMTRAMRPSCSAHVCQLRRPPAGSLKGIVSGQGVQGPGIGRSSPKAPPSMRDRKRASACALNSAAVSAREKNVLAECPSAAVAQCSAWHAARCAYSHCLSRTRFSGVIRRGMKKEPPAKVGGKALGEEQG
jgi:hypothetical protein